MEQLQESVSLRRRQRWRRVDDPSDVLSASQDSVALVQLRGKHARAEVTRRRRPIGMSPASRHDGNVHPPVRLDRCRRVAGRDSGLPPRPRSSYRPALSRLHRPSVIRRRSGRWLLWLRPLVHHRLGGKPAELTERLSRRTAVTVAVCSPESIPPASASTASPFTTSRHALGEASHPLHTLLHRGLPQPRLDSFDDRLTLDNLHCDRSGRCRSALLVRTSPTPLRAPDRRAAAPQRLHQPPASRALTSLHGATTVSYGRLSVTAA